MHDTMDIKCIKIHSTMILLATVCFLRACGKAEHGKVER